MVEPARKLKAGEVLFYESESAHRAYLLTEGRVVLTRQGPDGPVEIASLSQGELVGEAGLTRNGKHVVTATAATDIAFHEVDRQQFTQRLIREPEMGLRVIGGLTRRLDSMSGRIAHLPEMSAGGGASSHMQSRGVGGFGGWVRRLFGVQQYFPPPPMSPGDETGAISIALAALSNDEDDDQRTLIAETLETLPGVVVHTLSKSVEAGGEGEPLAVLTRANRAAHLVLERENADLLVWGRVDPAAKTIELRFASFSERDEERPGAANLLTWFALPTWFETEWDCLLSAVVLAAVEPRHEPQVRCLEAQLGSLLKDACEIGRHPPNRLGEAERAAVIGCFGNACATYGYIARDDHWCDRAVEAYQLSAETLPRDADLQWSLLHRSIGQVRQTQGERSDNAGILGQAADAYRLALEGILRTDRPRDWATLQYRLGEVLYKRILLDGSDAFKEVIERLQNALQVYDRADHPGRWAEIVHLLAEVLQVYGEEVKAVSLLRRAVDLCRQVLDVRPLDTNPLGWAAAQNTLGSALSVLSKTTQERAQMEEALECFQAALGTYRMMGSDRGARVALNNLVRIEHLLHGEEATYRSPVFPRTDAKNSAGSDKTMDSEEKSLITDADTGRKEHIG